MQNTENPVIVGLDIGTTKIAAIAGRRTTQGKVEILGFGRADSSGVEHGQVLNLEQCIKSIGIALERCLASNSRLEIREVYVGIAGQHIKSIQNRGERIRANADEIIRQFDLEELIRDQRKAPIPAGNRIIDIVAQDYTVDNFTGIVDPRGRTGTKIGANFHIITGDANAIKNIKRAVDESGLRTKDLVLQPLASAAAVMSAEEFEAGVAIVDIGGGTTDLAVFADNMLRHTKVIPFAGVNITNDIRKGLTVLRAQAEQLKVQFGVAIADLAPQDEFISIPGIHGAKPKEISRKNLAHIIQARMEEILDFVMYEIRNQKLEDKIGAGIILTGGGSNLQHLRQLTEYRTGMNARMGTPVEHLAPGYPDELKNPIYATCIGLILRGISDAEKGRTTLSHTEDVVVERSKEVAQVATPTQSDLFTQWEVESTQQQQVQPSIDDTEVVQTQESEDLEVTFTQDAPKEEVNVDAQLAEEVSASSEVIKQRASKQVVSQYLLSKASGVIDLATSKVKGGLPIIRSQLDARAATIAGIFGTISSQLLGWFEEVDEQRLEDNEPNEFISDDTDN